jgi:hypothetical protein
MTEIQKFIDDGVVKMHGPVQVEVAVWIINDNTREAGKASIKLPALTYPTPELIAEQVAKFEATALVGELEGFRLMSKKEAFSACSLERYEMLSTLQSHDEWDSI